MCHEVIKYKFNDIILVKTKPIMKTCHEIDCSTTTSSEYRTENANAWNKRINNQNDSSKQLLVALATLVINLNTQYDL